MKPTPATLAKRKKAVKARRANVGRSEAMRARALKGWVTRRKRIMDEGSKP